MSEHDANHALTATARMRMLAEPVENGKLMTFSERQYRAREARGLMVAGLVADSVQAQIDAIASTLNVETATGAALDALCRIPLRPVGMTDEEVRQRFADRQVDAYARDFRDGRCVHGNGRLSCEICAIQDGRV